MFTRWSLLTMGVCLMSNLRPYLADETKPRTEIAFKDPFIRGVNPILTSDAGNFKETVKRSSLFVDKSLFIKTFIEQPSHLYLSCPRYWGKTFNLKMLRTFFEIEMDRFGKPIPREETFNYRLFHKAEVLLDNGGVEKLEKPLLISEHKKLLEEYQGRYPVVYLDMSTMCPTRYVECAFQMKAIIQECFYQHSFLTEALANTSQIQIFEEIFNGAYSKRTAISCLKELCEILHNHFGSRVVMMIDGFDNFLITLSLLEVDGQDKQDMLQFVNLIVDRGINNNPYLFKAIVTATTDMAGDFFGLRHTARFGFIKHEIYEYFGFTERVTMKILDRLEFTKELKHQAKEWYNGFRAGRKARRRIYDPASVSFHISDRKFRSYWNDDRVVDQFVEGLLTVETFRLVAITLASGGNCTIAMKTMKFQDSDFRNCKKVMRKALNLKSGFMPYKYLFVRGYLTLSDPRDWNSTTVQLKIPNRDVAKAWRKKISDHYEIKLNMKPKRYRSLIYQFGANLSEFFRSDEHRCDGLVDTLDALMKEIPNFKRLGRKLDGIETTVDVLLQYLAVFVESFIRVTSKVMAFYNHDRLVILRTSYEAESAKVPMREAKFISNKVTLPREVDAIRYVGVNVMPDRTTEIYAVTEYASYGDDDRSAELQEDNERGDVG